MHGVAHARSRSSLQRVSSTLDVDGLNRGPVLAAVDASGTVDGPTTSLDPLGQLAGIVPEVSRGKSAAEPFEETGVGPGPMQSHHCVALFDQALGNVGAEQAGAAREKDAGWLRWRRSLIARVARIAQIAQSFRPSASAVICICGNIGLWSRYSRRSLAVSVSYASSQRP